MAENIVVVAATVPDAVVEIAVAAGVYVEVHDFVVLVVDVLILFFIFLVTVVVY